MLDRMPWQAMRDLPSMQAMCVGPKWVPHDFSISGIYTHTYTYTHTHTYIYISYGWLENDPYWSKSVFSIRFLKFLFFYHVAFLMLQTTFLVRHTAFLAPLVGWPHPNFPVPQGLVREAAWRRRQRSNPSSGDPGVSLWRSSRAFNGRRIFPSLYINACLHTHTHKRTHTHTHIYRYIDIYIYIYIDIYRYI